MSSNYNNDATSSSSVGIKKGEVAAMSSLLQDSELMKDPVRREKLFSRILFYVAQGIDMSSIFPQMIINASTKDYLEKKLIYQYLTYYAPIQSDLALLCVNTFRQDFRSESPHIRGLALRSLAQLRVRSLLEYVVPCITAGLVDKNSYVRSVAVMSTLQLYYFSKETFDENKYFDTLFELLRDQDPNVSGNCVCVINEIIGNTNTAVLTKQLIVYLLTRLSSYNDWHAINVLTMVHKYKTASEEEMYDIMNLLDKYFRSTNSGIVFAIAQVFLSLTHSDDTLHRQVAHRLVAPLVTLMSSPSAEIAFTALKHAQIIQQKYPGSFNKYYTAFFWREGDPVALKALKLHMLELVACDSNQADIISELEEYILDPSVGPQAVLSLGEVGVRVPSCFDSLSLLLQSILSLGETAATRAVIIAVQNILRRYPDAYPKFIPLLGAHFYSFDSTEAKCALIYIIGQFGEHIPSAPYLLEQFVKEVSPQNNTNNNDNTNINNNNNNINTSLSPSTTQNTNILGTSTVRIQLSLLSALTRLFFLRMGEVKIVLGNLLADIIGDAPQGVVRDRALFVYRMLRDNLSLAREIFLTQPEKIKRETNKKLLREHQREKKREHTDTGIAASYAEDESNVLKEQVWKEFGTFSVIYGHTEHYFTIPITQSLKLGKLVREAQAQNASVGANKENNSQNNIQNVENNMQNNIQNNIQTVQKETVYAVPNSPCAPQKFQKLWKSLTESFEERMPLPSTPSSEEWKSLMLSSGYTVVALGKKGSGLRMFVYTATNTGSDVCAEVVSTQSEIICTVKSDDAGFASEFAMTLLSCFV